MLSTLEIVTTLAAELSVTLSVPAPRSIEPLDSRVVTVTVSLLHATKDRLDVGHRAGVGEVAERQGVGAGYRGRCYHRC